MLKKTLLDYPPKHLFDLIKAQPLEDRPAVRAVRWHLHVIQLLHERDHFLLRQPLAGADGSMARHDGKDPIHHLVSFDGPLLLQDGNEFPQ